MIGQNDEKIDRRVIKTRRAIRNAFIKLIAEKDFNDISVKNIADEADVDRKTFYNHYNGIYEIREELENDLVEILDQAVKELDFTANIRNPLHIFEILTDILNTNLELYGYLMKMNAHSHIVRKIYETLKEKVCAALESNDIGKNGENRNLCAVFITSGLITVYQHWFNSDRKVPLSEISRDVGRLVLYGIKDFTNE